jgi:prepilin-type N-terminal cleavage/methylation domain-containing protein
MKNESGFTLVELLAVIVILGIFFSIAVISLGDT